MSRLQGKVALITGAGSNPGLGYSIALRFAEEGARLAISDINEETLRLCETAIRKIGAEVIAFRQDVTSEPGWAQAMDAILSKFGRFDVLVNNAGIAIQKPIEELTLADYERQMSVNMTSVFLGTRAAIPHLRKAGGGSIVNISSIAGLVGIPGVSAYSTSKGGVRLFSKTIAIECARDQIRCNSLHPGIIETNIQKGSLTDNPEQYQAIKASVPLGRMGSPLDVANCVVFLASDEASYVTGTELVVDGGWSSM
ncbi:MAG: glucose 1-dehydrogenase [Desulfuromonadales bacterium]|nr:glucose 1-dehydrogenase [Desulfuromonadales bacterium]